MDDKNSTESNLDYQGGRAAVRDGHDSVRREKPEPVAGGSNKVLISWVAGAGIVLMMAGGYFNGYSNSFDSSDSYIYPGYVAAARPVVEGVDADAEQKPWIEVWMKDGKKVYTNCIACHQAAGTGTPGLFPPLKGSEWVDGGTERLGMIVLSGILGPLNVSGSTYNQPMPAWGALNDEKLAQVLTYIRREFGELPEGQSGVVTKEMMKAAREKHVKRTSPWTEADLLAIPGDAELPGVEVDLNTGQPVAGE
ncbi:MAG: cytochrome c [Verrucomicrobiota bacterium]